MSLAVEAQPPTSAAAHPLVSTLVWFWNRLSAKDGAVDIEKKSTGSRTPGTDSGGELGLMWNEEYGGHLDLYAEYVLENKKQDKKSIPALKGSSDINDDVANSGKDSPYTFSPGWGWYAPITPPRDLMPPLPQTFFVSSPKLRPKSSLAFHNPTQDANKAKVVQAIPLDLRR